MLNRIVAGFAAVSLALTAGAEVRVGAVSATGPKWNYRGFDPFPETAADKVEIMLTPGEYEPATVLIRSDEELKGLVPSVGDLRDAKGRVFPASAFDFRIVKVMARASRKGTQLKPPVLKPSVLVHDDAVVRTDEKDLKSFVRIDLPGQGSYYRSIMNIVTTDKVNLPDAVKSAVEWNIRDAKEIRPTDLGANRLLRYWITVRAPDGAKAGTYRGEVAFAANGGTAAKLPVEVTVLPFRLPETGKRFGDLSSDYMTGLFWKCRAIDFDPKSPGSITGIGMNELQVRRQAENIRAHGIDHPEMMWKLPFTWCAGSRNILVKATPEDEDYICRFFGILKDTGFPLKELHMNMWAGCFGFYDHFDAQSEHQRMMLKSAMADASRILKKAVGHDNYSIFGIDEANNERIDAQYGFWRTVREFGGRNCESTHPTNIWRVADYVDLNNVAYEPQRKWADLMHAKGGKLTLYGHPQAELQGQSYPFRVSYGFKCYLADYDGFQVYHYNENGASGWEEFSGWRSIYYGYVYQTADGVLDTPSWEGQREAIDDVRYATKMMQEIARIEADPAAPAEKKALAHEAKEWLGSIRIKTGWWDPDSDTNKKMLERGYDFDPEATRKRIIEYILKFL